MTDAPLPHPGTRQQIRKNRLTHYWHTLDGNDYRCLVCDANAFGTTADYPCGQEPPRQAGHLPVNRYPLGKVPYETDGMDLLEPDLNEAETPDTPWGHTP